MKFKSIVLLAVFLVMTMVCTASAGTEARYVAGSWDPGKIYLLDENMSAISSIDSLAWGVNGIASDGTYIYGGYFGSNQVIAYTETGTEAFRWSGNLGKLQGMTMVGSELAIAQREYIEFYNPTNGAFIRSITGGHIGSTIEGLAYDGSLIWAIGDELLGINPADGALMASLPNAALGEGFGGTGIATVGTDRLMLAALSGNWYVVSKADGSVLSSGNNGLGMYALDNITASVAVPEPASMLLLGLGFMGLWGFRKQS